MYICALSDARPMSFSAYHAVTLIVHRVEICDPIIAIFDLLNTKACLFNLAKY